MSRQIQRTRIAVPQELELDALTRYVYRHYHALLTDRERAADKYHIFRLKSLETKPGSASDPRSCWLASVERDFPDLVDQLEREGVVVFMAAAANRILQEHSQEIVLNKCPKCQVLCRTPVALQCLTCGHDWHTQEPQS